MPSDRSVLESQIERVELRPFTLDRFHRRRQRKERNRRVGSAMLALVVAVVAIGGLLRAFSSSTVPGDELGLFTPVAGRILYVNEGTDVGYDRGIWAVDPNGPSDTTDGPGVADDVASTLVPLGLGDAIPLGWSSDGTELLFMRTDGDSLFPREYLYILHADGSETRLNRDPMYFGGATISPDGTRVVFAVQAVPADDVGLYVVDAEGGRPVRLPLPGAEGIVVAPTFSPDGTQIAYLDTGDRANHVWVADADGTDAHELLVDKATVLRGVSGLEWSPAGDRIAIGIGTHERSGGSIYTFAPDGSDFTKVIVGGSSPYWSPDGSQIAYTIQCDEDPTFTCVQFDPQAGSSPAGLAIADADGSNVRAFGFAASGPWHPGASVQTDDTTPTPSDSFARANGEVLRFTTPVRSTRSFGDLVAVNPETGGERVLVENLSNVTSAEWSSDGRWVAYERFPLDTGGGKLELWVVGASREPRLIATGGTPGLFADGTVGWVWSRTGADLLTAALSSLDDNVQTIERSTLTVTDFSTGETMDLGSMEGDVGLAPAWSPDGTRIALVSGDGAVYSVDLGSGERSLLVRLPDDVASIAEILWSPDGARIALLPTRESDKTSRLFVMDADGSNIRVLADDYDPLGIEWSPDGTRLAFGEGSEAYNEVRIRVAPIDGAPTEIGTVAYVGCHYHYTCGLTWSPDGSAIAFGKDEGEDSVIAADGSGEAELLDELTYRSWDGGSYSCGC
jgi:Tol biopolymer transport system component